MQRRNEECYSPVIQILKYLVHNNLQEGTGAVLNQQGGLPVAAAEEAKAGILRVSQAANEAAMLKINKFMMRSLVPLASLLWARRMYGNIVSL